MNHAFLHFFYLDKANAAIHMADVRFSPITFALAEGLKEHRLRNVQDDLWRALVEVYVHEGTYELDKGR